MNESVVMSSRSVYNIFDYVGDLGGIQGSLLIFASAFAKLFNGSLGKVQKAEALYKVSASATEGGDTLDTSPDNSIKRLSWFVNLQQFRLSLSDKISLILCGCCCRLRCFNCKASRR